VHQLPAPQIIRCYFEDSFDSHLPAMELRWDPDVPGGAERTWYFPDCLSLQGPPPERFALTIRRCGDDAHDLRVLWNRLCLNWDALSRTEIMASSLTAILAALGTDLWYLLSQPVEQQAA
jgi:hypothetical protein